MADGYDDFRSKVSDLGKIIDKANNPILSSLASELQDLTDEAIADAQKAGQESYSTYLDQHPERLATAPPWVRLTPAAQHRWIKRGLKQREEKGK